MGNEDTDKELSQTLLLGRSSFWGMLPRRLRWETVAIRRVSGTCRDARLGPEGVEGEELGLCQSEGGGWRVQRGHLQRHKLCGLGVSGEAVARQPL